MIQKHNKKGQLLGLYIVLLVISMIIITFGLYPRYQENVRNSLVSPLPVLELADQQELFELQEEQIMQEAEKEACSSTANTRNAFEQEFKKAFSNKITTNMKEFIKKNITLERSAEINLDNYIKEVIYGQQQFNLALDGKTMYFDRPKITKTLELKPKSKEKIGYPLTMTYEFERRHEIAISCTKDFNK